MGSAATEYRRALELDPKNWNALVMLGLLFSNDGKLDQAREWYAKAQAIDPLNADIWTTLGVIAWRQSLDPMKARGPIIEEAISDFEKALALNPKNEDAMVFLNLLLRTRAELHESGEQRREYIAAADRWLQKSHDVRSEKVQAASNALRQWVYRPTLVDGKPVKVVTEVRVEFERSR